MNDKTILNIGKYTFGLCFLFGNICLFGFIIFKNDLFADAGYFLLIFASIFNLFVIAGLLVYGFFNKSKLNVCYKSAGILLINIPIAILYAVIGISILDS